MKKENYFLLSIFVLIFSLPSFGQKTVVVVEPDPGIEIGALNKAILAVDSLQRDNTIFELRRDGHYYLNGAISHIGYTLHIRTEDGAGSKAVIVPGLDELGESDRQFNPSGNLTLERVYVLGRDELGASNQQPINVLADNCRIIIDDCVMDYSAQSFVRTGSKDNKIYIKNSILRNCTKPDDPANGRIIDTRGNPNDTLWISQCTIYNSSATQLRSDGAKINFANFDHNTVFATAFAHNMALDYMLKVKITNNIFFNFLWRGNNTSHDAMFRADSISVARAGVLGYDDADRYFDLSNNNWYVDDTIAYIDTTYGPLEFKFYSWDTEQADTIWYKQMPRKNWFANDYLIENDPESTPDIIKFIESGQVDTSNLFREKLTFENPPPLNLDYWKFYAENGFNIRGMDTPQTWADENPLVLGEVQTGAFNFRYNTDSRSHTGADHGLPLGALRWWPEVAVSAKDIKLRNGVSAFPNPFDNQVTFQINAGESSVIKVQIYDMLGREMHSFNGTVNQGDNEINVNLGDLKQSGIFLYQIQFETRKGMKSISSGKIIKK
ncbi:T9SS type A sorting domain-containing protein [Bacteroidota bacterium]